MGCRYIGSKARIVDSIANYIGAPNSKSGYFIDAFSGTGIVASKAADLGWKIRVNDMMESAAIISEAKLLSVADIAFSSLGGYEKALERLMNYEREGFIWKEYSPASVQNTKIERRYFTENNARKIDGITKQIHTWKEAGIISNKEFVLLEATLISAVNDVANIAGTYGCFLSKWQPQALSNLVLHPLELRRNKVEYSCSIGDVFNIKSESNDVVYLDPPYTKRQYASYYHILETITKADEPSVNGVAGLRPWKDKASVFCYKMKALKALINLVSSQGAERVFISYSNDGHIQLNELIQELAKIGTVNVIELGSIARYQPNVAANLKTNVKEYLVEYRKGIGK